MESGGRALWMKFCVPYWEDEWCIFNCSTALSPAEGRQAITCIFSPLDVFVLQIHLIDHSSELGAVTGTAIFVSNIVDSFFDILVWYSNLKEYGSCLAGAGGNDCAV